MTKVFLKRLAHAFELPQKQTVGAAGADIYAALEQEIPLAPLERALIPTGFQIAVPLGFEAQIRPRSGLALKQGVTVLNSPGTIDSDYRGEVMVLLVNLGAEPVIVKRGDRIAQLVVAPVPEFIFETVESLDKTTRGAEGFGSTGVRDIGARVDGINTATGGKT